MFNENSNSNENMHKKSIFHHHHRHMFYSSVPSALALLHTQLQFYSYQIWTNPASLAYVKPLDVPITEWTWALPPDHFKMTRIDEIDKAFNSLNHQKIIESVSLTADIVAKFFDKQKAVDIIDLALKCPELDAEYRCSKKHFRSIKTSAFEHLNQLKAAYFWRPPTTLQPG